MPKRPQPAPPDTVQLGWLIRAIVAVILAAFACVYLADCLLFYQGQWQLVFHPSRLVKATPPIPYEDIHFFATETGQPQLNGWFIPAPPGAQYASYTLLYCHEAFGSLSDTLPALETLHALGLNLFAFDYRGFGRSADLHPSQQSTYADASAAFEYLTGTRHIDPAHILLYGSGIGAAVATETVRLHPQVPALILERPIPDLLGGIRQQEPHSRALPLTLIFHDRFELVPTLRTLTTPKLFYDTVPPGAPSDPYRAAYSSAADPKFLYAAPDYLSSPQQAQQYLSTLRRFLDDLSSRP